MKCESLDDDTLEMNGIRLYRIRYLRNGKNYYRYQLGGYIPNEETLSQTDESAVKEFARIASLSVTINGDSVVGDKVIISGKNVVITDNATVRGDIEIKDNDIVIRS